MADSPDKKEPGARSRRGWLTSATMLYTAAFCVSLAAGTIGLGIVFYARDVLEMSPGRVGQLASVWSVSYVLGCIFVRPLVRSVAPRHLIVIANALMGVTLAALLQSKSAAWAFATYATFGCALSLFWPTVQGWLSTGREGPELGRTMSRFNIAWGGANMASPYICGWMAEQSLVLPIQVSSLLYVAVAIFVAGVGWMVPGIRNDPGRVETREAGPAEDRSSYFRFPAWVGLFACYFGAGMIASTFPMAGKEVLHLSERTIGGILLVQAAANVAGFLALGKLHFWHFRLYPMNVALLIRVAMFVLLIFVNSPVGISLIMVVLGATWATGYSASIFHGASGSRDRAKRMTIHESVIASAILFGGVAGAMLYERWSIRVSYGACAAVSLLGIAIQSAVAAAMKAKERGGRTTMLNAEC